MNKQTNITPPGKRSTERGARKSSLLERASGAFGFDKLKPANVPVVLEGEAAKKFAPRRRVLPRPVEDNAPLAAPVEGGSAAPATVATAPVVDVEPDTPEIVFSGPRREIPRALLRDQGLIDPDGGASRLLEEFRIVKRQVLATAKSLGTPVSRRVLICSPHPNEGKTFCAINLAIAMAAERDSEVLLIDADFGKPSVLSKLGINAERGFMDVLADPAARVEDAVIGTDIPGLWVLGAGSRTGRDSEYLASDRTREILTKLTRGARNRMLVFDSPPALAATPAAELAKLVGQSLLVARADNTGRAALEDAVDLLAACADIRLLLNDTTFSPSGRKFGSYYGYGEPDQ